MIGFLLSLLPGAWLAVLKSLPWRLIGYAVAAALVVWAALTVNGWRLDSRALEATQKALETATADRDRYAAREASARQALREAAGKAAEKEAADKATAERIEHELQTKLAAADTRGRDLARRLSIAARAACPGGGAVPGAADPAGQPGQAAGEPGDGEAIERATAEHLAACGRDAERLAGWQAWWGEVSSGRLISEAGSR